MQYFTKDTMSCIGCNEQLVSVYSNESYLKLPIYHCKKCDLYTTGQTQKQLEDGLKNHYKNSTLTKEIKKTIDNDYESDYGRYVKNQWFSQKDYCKPYYQNHKSLLEIGPGTGLALTLFENEGFQVTGVEAYEKNVDFINKKLKNGRCVFGFAEDTPFTEKFDIIWLSHCFEHIIRPDLLLQKCKEDLSDDGFIFIAVPDCENKKMLKMSIDDNASSYHYTKKSLKILAQNAGLKVKECDSMRELYKIEGGIHLRLKKYFSSINKKICPFYPFKKTKEKGAEIRIILKKS